jgi:AcrR family transcriptional regulator
VDVSERSKIIAAADRCLALSDDGGVSVSGILAEAGLSTRAFYRHFESKDALLLALFRRDSERVFAELRAAADAAPGPAEALRRWIDGFLGPDTGVRRHRVLVLAAADGMVRGIGYAAERDRWAGAHRAAIADILRRGRDDGSLPWADPEPDARIIMAALSEAFRRPARDAAARLTDFAFRALGARHRTRL